MEEMTTDRFYAILNAKEAICSYCGKEKDDPKKCMSCQVTALVDNAQTEAHMWGLI